MSRASDAVPRHVHEAGRDGIGRVSEAHLGAVHEQLATGRSAGSREDAEELVLPLPLEAHQAEHLAGAQLEGDVRELRAEAQVAQLEARRGGRRQRRAAGRAGRDALVDGRLGFTGGAEHELDDALLGARAHLLHDPHRLAVAEDGGAVAEGADLEQAVGDEDDRLAGLTPAAHDVEHPLGEVGGQRRGHLVEEQDVRVDGQRPGQVEDAQHGERQVAHHGVPVQVEGTPSSVTQPMNGSRGASGEAQVGRHVEVGDERRLLVDGDHAGLAGVGRRVHLARLAADDDAAPNRGGRRR